MNKDYQFKHLVMAALIGIILGGAIMPPLMHWHFRHYWKRDKMRDHMFHKFSRKVDLTPEQKEKAKVIFDEKRKKIDAVRAEMNPRLEEIRNAARAEIRTMLNEDQLKKFEKFDAKMSARRKKWRD